MGKSNIAVKQWLRDKKRFADLFNGTVFQGKQIILPEELEEVDSESSIIVTDKKNIEKGMQRYRDITMRWKQEAELAILACENQNKVHYAMPVRMMLYDSLTYTEQIRQIWKNREPNAAVTDEEYLSRFCKEDKIYPVIPLVFYYGLNKWDGSKDLYGMFYKGEVYRNQEVWKAYVSNYSLNLVDAGNVKDVKRFRSDLQLIFGMLKYRGKENGIKAYLESHTDYFGNIDIETYQAIRELLHSEKQFKNMVSCNNGKERIDMCTAIDAIYNNGVEEGIKVLILTCCEFGLSREEIVERITKNCSVTAELAKEFVEKYADSN